MGEALMSLTRLSDLVFGQVHYYDPRKAETFALAIGPRLLGVPINLVGGAGGVEHVAFENGRPSAGVIGDRVGRAYDRYGVRPFDMVEGVAVVGIEGTLVHKGGWVGASSGETSYEGLYAQIDRARADPKVKGAVFEVDSFGGMVNGAHEAADKIMALSREKPTIAILTDFAYSAGYLLASQARQIVVPEAGGAGSIGVVMLHADFSGNLEQEGIRVTLIHSGQHKVDGNPYEPLPEEVRMRWEARADRARDRFAEAVGRGRGKRLTKAAALKTEAMAYDAPEALSMGLVDAVGTPPEAFSAFIEEVNRKV